MVIDLESYLGPGMLNAENHRTDGSNEPFTMAQIGAHYCNPELDGLGRTASRK